MIPRRTGRMERGRPTMHVGIDESAVPASHCVSHRLLECSAFAIDRSPWHVENSSFCQRVRHWSLGRSRRPNGHASLTASVLWALVVSLLQLSIYHRLKRLHTSNICSSIAGIVAKMV